MPPSQPSTRILLVRHGQARNRQPGYGPDTPLSPLGQQQAGHIAAALRDAGVGHVIVSPFRRARDTAAPTVTALSTTAQVEPRLAEFHMEPDSLQVSAEQINAERRDLMLWRPHDQDGPGGETLSAFQTRVSAALDDLVALGLGGAVAVFTHSGTIAAAMRWAYGLTPNHDWHSDVEVFNGSITEIQHWPNGRHPAGAPFASAVTRLNDVRHLPPDQVTEV